MEKKNCFAKIKTTTRTREHVEKKVVPSRNVVFAAYIEYHFYRITMWVLTRTHEGLYHIIITYIILFMRTYIIIILTAAVVVSINYDKRLRSVYYVFRVIGHRQTYMYNIVVRLQNLSIILCTLCVYIYVICSLVGGCCYMYVWIQMCKGFILYNNVHIIYIINSVAIGSSCCESLSVLYNNIKYINMSYYQLLCIIPILYYNKIYCVAVGKIIFRKYQKKMPTLFIDKTIKYL